MTQTWKSTLHTAMFSEYHRMDKLADEDFEDEEPGNPDENVRRVVVIE